MTDRADTQKIVVEYTTAQKKVDAIPQLIEDSINSMDGVEYRRCVISSLAKNGIEFEISYSIKSKDIDTFKRKRHEILKEIIALFLKKKINLGA